MSYCFQIKLPENTMDIEGFVGDYDISSACAGGAYDVACNGYTVACDIDVEASH